MWWMECWLRWIWREGWGGGTEEMVARAVGQRLQVVVFIGLGVERVGKLEEVGERVKWDH
jgi:hypothetical protein